MKWILGIVLTIFGLLIFAILSDSILNKYFCVSILTIEVRRNVLNKKCEPVRTDCQPFWFNFQYKKDPVCNLQNNQSLLNSQIKAEIEGIRNALEMYRAEKNEYPASLNLLTPDYIVKINKNPSNQKAYEYLKISSTTYKLSTLLPDNLTYTVNQP